MKSDKSLIRKKYRSIRNSLSAQKSQLDKMIINNLSEILDNKKNNISIFYPINSEINLLPLIELRSDLKFLFPKITEDILTFYYPKKIAQDFTYNSKYKIYEPDIKLDIIIPEIVICPMLSFDSDMHRLGYGGGFYDRTIETLRKKHKITYIGVAYTAQKSKKLPSETHDQQLDMIVTEKGVI